MVFCVFRFVFWPGTKTLSNRLAESLRQRAGHFALAFFGGVTRANATYGSPHTSSPATRSGRQYLADSFLMVL